MTQQDLASQEILAAALSVFGSTGFKKATLSNVATLAGVSRPTLYARYRDKTELFRAVIEQAYDEALSNAAETIVRGGAFDVVLTQVLLDYYGGLFDKFHGLTEIHELALVKSEHANDLIDAARARWQSLLGRLLRERNVARDISTDKPGVPIAQIVDLLRLAPLSLKEEGTSRALYRKQLCNLAKVVAAALSAD
jgi:AcrR family transcriptional regulator